MFLYLLFSNSEIPLVDKLRISSFNVVSILSGTGYVTDDFGLWGEFPLIFFSFNVCWRMWAQQLVGLKYLDFNSCTYL